MMTMNDYTAYLGKYVSFFLPCRLPTTPHLDGLHYAVSGLVTAVTLDVNPADHRITIDDEQYYLRDCVFVRD